TPDPFDQVTGMPNLLAQSGYHVGWSHKWHMRPSLIGGQENEYSEHGSAMNRFSQTVSRADDPEEGKARILKQVRNNFRDFLKDRQEGQPFFYSFNPTNTHRPWV